MIHTIRTCPACGSKELTVERLRCIECGTAVEGRFRTSTLGSLPMEHQEFIEVFVRCRGNIKDVERVLGISYPTVRGRLDRAIQSLGYETPDEPVRRRRVLEALENGEISAKEALEALKEGKE